MKKIVLSVFISLFLGLLVVSSTLASLPDTGWWSAIRIQNIDTTSGSVRMDAYDKDSTSIYDSQSFNINPEKSLVYDPGLTPNYSSGGNIIGFNSPLPSGFTGSVVLSSSIKAASVSQIANYSNHSIVGTGYASALYPGISTQFVATKLLATTIKHGYSRATTTLYIQAAGADADVTVTYTMADGTTHTDSETIEANRMFIFDPANATPPVEVNCTDTSTHTSPCYGSAIITSSSPIAGVLLEHAHVGSPSYYVRAVRLSTPQDESTKLYVPSIKNDFCGDGGCGIAGAAIMNVGTESAEVKITLTVTKLGTNASPDEVEKGDTFTNTVTIEPGTNYNFSKYNDNLGGLPTGTMAAAVIESLNDVPLVGISNDTKTYDTFPGYPGIEGMMVKYTAYADELATPLSYAPMVKEFLGDFTGGATVQNVGSSADYIVIEYHEYGTNDVCTLRTLDPVPVGGAAETNWVSRSGGNQFSISGDCDEFSDLAGKEFSVVAYTETGQNIILMVTENTPDSILDISRYEGINVEE